ncbi:MAG: DUF4190 domain-containing protein [Micrococcales bacterium]|nr:DUF4190 domain-containing protein [Micrococcales bacterium]NBR61509.1 DUF4190 domain-containing protein [Actinomycetota bacterium]NBT47013.1 DUF4190 domain-containing protein [Actinomycetota bacterium]NBY43553.1 DUF4190 domain-containing protein [Micrococcales bacterium]NDE89138.1 DUF4190 domain-containing protein [Micrococcales bacterium]
MAEAKKYDYTKLNTLAVVSLATGLTLFGAPAALISGHLALAQLKQTDQTGRWMAITGVVLGYVGIGIALIATIVNLVVRARHGVDFMGDDQFMNRHNDNDGGNWNMPPMNN